MFDAGQIKPGQAIAVVGVEYHPYQVADLQYQVLPADSYNRRPVYRVLYAGTGEKFNVKNLLKDKKWYVEETPAEQTE